MIIVIHRFKSITIPIAICMERIAPIISTDVSLYRAHICSQHCNCKELNLSGSKLCKVTQHHKYLSLTAVYHVKGISQKSVIPLMLYSHHQGTLWPKVKEKMVMMMMKACIVTTYTVSRTTVLAIVNVKPMNYLACQSLDSIIVMELKSCWLKVVSTITWIQLYMFRNCWCKTLVRTGMQN